MISNQYHNQQSFNGHLLKAGIKLPAQKFEEVAELYSKRTPGKPDLVIVGHVGNGDKGQFYHAATLFRGDEDIAGILSSSLKNMFEKLSPKKMADELVNLSRKADPEDKANILLSQIHAIQKRLMTIKLQLEQNQPKDVQKNLNVIKSRMESTILAKQKQYDRIKPGEVSGEWC